LRREATSRDCAELQMRVRVLQELEKFFAANIGT